MYAAKVAAVGETEDALIEFESDVHVDAVGAGTISAREQFLRIAKPDELAIEFEMKSNNGVGKFEPEVFALAAGSDDFLILGGTGELCRRLRFCGDGVKNMDAANEAILDERAQSAHDGFYFREFRHQRL